MKTSYSRRELYALGEPIGESSTYELAGRRVYGGGGGGLGGIVSGIANTVGDVVSGAANTVGDVAKGAGDVVGDTYMAVRDPLEAAAVVGGNYVLPGSGLVTSHLVSDSAKDTLNSGLGQAALLASGVGGGLNGNLSNWTGGAEPVSGIDLGGAGSSPSSMTGSYADAIGADNIDIGGGWNPATGTGDAATAAGAAATGLTNSAGTAYGLPTGGLSTLANLLKGTSSGSNANSGGLSLGGAALGAAGLASLLNMLKADSSRYGVPGRQDNVGSMGQFKYNPATFSATRPNPNMFKPQGIPTAQIGYGPTFAEGGTVGGMGMPWAGPMEQQQQVPTPDAVPPAVNSGVMRMAHGGLSSLGGYSDGGRLLKGPGDGMSDNIPASIGHKQPARLADGEFVVPADVVSHLGNGSTDAGAKQLYKMMDRVRSARTGRKAQGKEIKADKYLPK